MCIVSSVTTISETAFEYCEKLSVTLGKGLTRIEKGALRDVKEVHVNDLASYCKIDYGYDNSKDIGCLIYLDRLFVNGVKASNISTLEIPEGVEKIGLRIFQYWNLEKIKLPSTLKTISAHAFRGTELKEINLPNKLEEIGPWAFRYCDNLESIVIPDSVTKLGQGAFMESNLENITLGNGLEGLPFNAFASCRISRVEIPDGMTYIGTSAFNDCGVNELILPVSMVYIYAGSFYYPKVYYKGTIEQYDILYSRCLSLDLDAHIPYPTSDNVYYYSKNKPNEEGNYWYYDENGEIAVWEY